MGRKDSTTCYGLDRDELWYKSNERRKNPGQVCDWPGCGTILARDHKDALCSVHHRRAADRGASTPAAMRRLLTALKQRQLP